MSKIVISYRRSDSEAMAGRIHDCLVNRYGESSVYMDIESIPAGVDFRTHINKAIHGAHVFLAIVGPKWRGHKRSGGTRIAEDVDPVRAELEAAMERKIPVVPVLVDDAVMPKAEDLPPKIKDFSFHNAVPVDAGRDFRLHMDRLIEQIDKLLDSGASAKLHGPWPWIRAARRMPVRTIVTPTLAVCVVLLGALLVLPGLIDKGAPTPPKPEPNPPTGGPWVPPPNRSYWEVDKSIVYQEATADERQLFYVEPSAEMRARGIEPGTLMFEGRKAGDSYTGKVYAYAPGCDPVSYEVSGPILDGPKIELIGKAPRIDHACRKLDVEDARLVVKFKERK
jgi:TIR domain